MLDQEGWWVVVPMKDTRHAKSRLGGSSGTRRQLAILMARDTLRAAVNADRVEGVLVVCDREEDVESFALPGVTVVVRPGLGLNDAIRAGADLVRAEGAERNLAALLGDLPYLHSRELDAALSRASAHPSTVVPDRTGGGTTLLTARGGTELCPRFGPESLGRHVKAGAVPAELPSWSGLRCDVDVSTDLVMSAALGLRTRTLLEDRRTTMSTSGTAVGELDGQG